MLSQVQQIPALLHVALAAAAESLNEAAHCWLGHTATYLVVLVVGWVRALMARLSHMG